MLISDDIDIGLTIEFHFIRRGLENNETCIYLTHGSTKQIEREMIQYGIDVDNFKKKNCYRFTRYKTRLKTHRYNL
jgi:hypothetical protein